MSELIVVGYPNPQRAQEALSVLRKLETQHLIRLEDAVIVTRRADGKVRLQQSRDLRVAGAIGGTLWGLLIGALFAAPLLGAVVGALAGAISGALSDVGIDDDFMRELGAGIVPGSAALSLLIEQVTPDRVLEQVARFGGTVMHTSLSRETERALIETLSRATPFGPSTTAATEITTAPPAPSRSVNIPITDVTPAPG